MESSPHILIVDDRHDIREPLKRYLEPHGFRIALAGDAIHARQLLKGHHFDLAVLDIMMPGEDGLSLCRFIQSQSALPVIFLTAMAEDTDRIVGLEMGADDYLVKPFNPRELLARIKAVLRRTQSYTTTQSEWDEVTVWRFNQWVLKSNTRKLEHQNGKQISLSSGEYALLVVMLNRPHHVLSRDQLLDLTQGRSADAYDRAIDNQVSRLRKKTDPFTTDDAPIIQTVWGAGYKLVANVEKG